MEYEQLWKLLPQFGPYQQLIVWLLTIPGSFMNAYNSYVMVFTLNTPNHRCKFEPNETYESFSRTERTILGANGSMEVWKASECQMTVTSTLSNETVEQNCSNGWLYDQTYFDRTIVSEWDLVCDRSYHASHMLSMFSVGGVVACLILSLIMDSCGRRLGFLFCATLYIGGSLLTLAASSWQLYTLAGVLSTMPWLSTYDVCYVWSIEYVGPSKHTLVTVLRGVTYSIAIMSLPLLAYFFRTWMQLTLAITLPFLFTLTYVVCLYESPEWLLSQGRRKEAKRIFRRIAKWDRSHWNEEKMEEFLNEYHVEPRRQHWSRVFHEAVSLFRRPNIRRKTLIITALWITNTLTYSTIPYNVTNLGADIRLSFLLQGAVELPASLLNLYSVRRFGTIWPMSVAMLTSGLFCFLTAVSHGISPHLELLCVAVGKFGISTSYNILYQVAGELFPTVIRGTGIGISSLVGDSAYIAMPYILVLGETYTTLPLIILGFLGITSGVLALFLPDPRHNQYNSVPITIDDGERMGLVNWQTFKDKFRRSKTVETPSHSGESSSVKLEAADNANLLN